MRFTAMMICVLSLCGLGAPEQSSRTQIETYASIHRKVVQAFDASREDELRAEFLVNEDRAVYSYGVALIDLYAYRMFSLKARTKLPLEANVEVKRKRIKRIMMHDPHAAEPVALYAWFVSQYREPGMPEPKQELLGEFPTTLSNGKVVMTPVYKVISDPYKQARVKELYEKAISLDKQCPLARYGIAANAKPGVESARLLWDCLGPIGEYIFETDALYRIKSRAPDDKEMQRRVAERIAQLKAKIGAESPRLRAYGF